MALPKKINLGCGHVVKVDLVPRATIQGLIAGDIEACWIHETPAGTGYIGTIYVDRSLSQAKQKEALYHELQHATVDLFQVIVDSHR